VEREFRVVTRELGRGLDALEAALRGEGDTEHWARVRLTLVPGEVMLEFTDDGRAFDPLAARPPALGAPAERSLGGLGLHLIRSLVDAAEYARLGSANVLTLKKRLGGSDVDVP
jgi:anti-sigma regulatory factor (Ser/Thr protein kinase)